MHKKSESYKLIEDFIDGFSWVGIKRHYISFIGKVIKKNRNADVLSGAHRRKVTEFMAIMDLCKSKGNGSSLTNAMKDNFLNTFLNVLEMIWKRDTSDIDSIHDKSTNYVKIVMLLLQG